MLHIDTDLPAGRIKRVHVNLWCVKSSAGEEPCITCKTGGKNYYGRAVRVLGGGDVVQAMDKPLSCGARVYVETKGAARVTQAVPAELPTLTRIHVSQSAIRSNVASGADEPCVVVLRGKQQVHARTLRVLGDFVMLQEGTSIFLLTDAATREVGTPATATAATQASFFAVP